MGAGGNQQVLKYDVSTASLGDVLRDVRVDAPVDVKSLLPSEYLLKKQIRNNRTKIQSTPSSPTTASANIFPEEY